MLRNIYPCMIHHEHRHYFHPHFHFYCSFYFYIIIASDIRTAVSCNTNEGSIISSRRLTCSVFLNMALPVVKSLSGCSDFSNTVLPYVDQLYDLPQQILQSYNNPTELQNIYLATNPLISAFACSLFLAPLFLIVSEINRNYSQVDRCWSILPTVYNAHFVLYAHLTGLPTQRLDNLLAFSTVWSVSSSQKDWRIF